MSEYAEIEVPTDWLEANRAMMIFTGFAVEDPDGILRITDKGSDFILDYVRRIEANGA